MLTNGKLTLDAVSSTNYGTITGGGIVTGAVSMRMYLNLAGDGNNGRYFHLGSPFSNATLNDYKEVGFIMVSANTQQGTTWEWDATIAEWIPAGNSNLDNTAVNGQGYAIYAGTNSFGTFLRSGAGTITLTGSPTSDDVMRGLFYNDGQSTTTTGFTTGTTIEDTEGWNFLANPYPAAYDWDGQTIPTDMSATYYRFDGTNYSAYTKGAGTASRYIAPYQGFWVQLDVNTPENIIFSENNRTVGQTPALAKTNSYVIDGVDLTITNVDNAYDALFIGYETQSTVGFDREWDARKLINGEGVPNLSANLSGQQYSICRVPLSGPKSFPLMLDHQIANDAMTISIDRSRLSSFAKVELKDLKTGLRHDFDNGDYAFANDTAFGQNRFVLHFSQNTVGLSEELEKPQFTAYTYLENDAFKVELGNLETSSVAMYNLAGQLLFEAHEKQGLLNLPAQAAGVYIIKVSTQSGMQTLKAVKN